MDKPTRILMTALLVLLMAGSAMCETHTVCASGCDYTTIQAAINAASKDDTIIVDDGTYNENVIVNQTVIIGSENGSASTTIVAIDPKFHAVTITANDVDMSGFTVTGATGDGKAGICIDKAKDAYIFQNIMTGNDRGIYSYKALQTNVSCNTIEDDDACGIYIDSHGAGSSHFGFNDIERNGADMPNGVYEYQVVVNGSGHVDMENNYWGTTDESIIEGNIDHPNNCNVDFVPFLTAGSPCSPLPELSTITLMFVGMIGLIGLIRYKSGE